METSNKQTSLFGGGESTSSQGDSHANPTQTQGNDLVSKMSATCGLKCLEQFEKLNHVGLWAKTFAASLIGMEGWFSMKSTLTWRMKATKSGRSYFLLQASTLRTEGIEHGLLPTPTAVSRSATVEQTLKRKEKYGGLKRSMYLENYLALGMLPTPVASDVEGGISHPRQIKYKGTRWVRVSDNTGTEFGAKLRDVAQLLPTPTARDWKGKQHSEYIQDRGENPKFKMASVPGVVAKLTNTDGKPSQLNPQFVENMMGFPENWTLLPFLDGEKSQ